MTDSLADSMPNDFVLNPIPLSYLWGKLWLQSYLSFLCFLFSVRVLSLGNLISGVTKLAQGQDLYDFCIFLERKSSQKYNVLQIDKLRNSGD